MFGTDLGGTRPWRKAAAFLATVIVSFLTCVTSVNAEIFNVCEVLSTSDGFVALRDRPTTRGKLLYRMHPGDMAVIDVKDGNYVQSNNWLSIEFHRRDHSSKEEKYNFVAKGWAYTTFIVSVANLLRQEVTN